MNAVCLLLGVLLHIIAKVMEAKKAGNGNFLMVKWFQDNAWYLGSLVISAVLILIMVQFPKDDVQDLGGTFVNMTYLKLAAYGYAGASLLKNLFGFIPQKS